MAVSDNLFSFADWAGSESCGLANAGGATLAVDRGTGVITIASGSTQHVYTKFGLALTYYNMPVDPNAAYRLALTMAGTSTQSQVYYVPLGANMEQLNPGKWPYLAATPARGAGDAVADFTTPDGCRYVQLFFDVHDANRRMAFGDIRLYRMHVAERADGAKTYGTLPAPERDGCLFGGWYTAADGGGIRITRYSPATADALALYAHWVEPAMQFGQAGCSPIDVGPFEPICTRPEIGGSSPLTLNIPVPTYAPVVQPQECVCFEFARGTANGTVGVTTCGVDAKNAGSTLTVEITPAGDDCCGGKYQITPHLDLTIPCVPFTPGTVQDSGFKPVEGAGAINVRNTSGDPDRLYDGGVSMLGLQLDPDNCCTVRPVIDITFPDCKKYWDRSSYLNDDGTPKTQITYWAWDPVTKKAEEKAWTLISMVEDAEHCNTYPVVHPLTIPSCSVDDASASDEAYLATAPDGTTPVGKIKVTVSREACKPKVSIAVTKIKLPSPSGRGIGTGGPVLQAANGDLFTNAKQDGGKQTWFGGGVGDRADDREQSTLMCRGPTMRNNGLTDWAGIRVPVAMLDNDKTSLLTTDDYDENGVATQSQPKWQSSRAVMDASGTVTPDSNGFAEQAQPAAGYASGNLDMVIPSGFQWHPRGIATVLSEFAWSPSGMLSELYETGMAVLLSPAPAWWNDNDNYTPAILKGLNASGLAVNSGGIGRVTKINGDKVLVPPLSGLCVNAGGGMRVFGLDDRTTDAELDKINRIADADAKATALQRVGKLEVHAGGGMRVFGLDDRTAASEQSTAGLTEAERLELAQRTGQLEVRAGAGLRLFGMSEFTTAGEIQAEPANSTRKGMLEVRAGAGLRLFGMDSRTTAGEKQAEPANSTREGKLEAYAHSGDFAFVDGRLAINDEKANTKEDEPVYADTDIYEGYIPRRTRVEADGSAFGDYSIPVVLGDPLTDLWQEFNYHTFDPKSNSDYYGKNYRLAGGLERTDPVTQEPFYLTIGQSKAEIQTRLGDIGTGVGNGTLTAEQGVVGLSQALGDVVEELYSYLSTLRMVYMHVGKAGIITGVDENKSGASLTRRVSSS